MQYELNLLLKGHITLKTLVKCTVKKIAYIIVYENGFDSNHLNRNIGKKIEKITLFSKTFLLH